MYRTAFLRAARFETPDYIPMRFSINRACWNHYPHEALHEMMAGHPMLFPDFDADEYMASLDILPNARADEPCTDAWGCVWETTEDGITGTVTKHPIESWESFDGYVPPDPMTTDRFVARDWSRIRTEMNAARPTGELMSGGLQHGHTFLLLSDIRGYQNLLFDMVDDEPRLYKLIEMVEHFNLTTVKQYVDIGVDYFSYPEDLGMQVGPMLSPDMFLNYIKPSYKRLMAPAREAGCLVHMHSDGDIRDLADDLVDGGVQILNLQDLVNGIDWIAENYAGKICIDLDLDRQMITPHGTPQQIDDLIREEVEKLSTKKGGLMILYGMYPGVPLENAKAIMDSMERYSLYHS